MDEKSRILLWHKGWFDWIDKYEGMRAIGGAFFESFQDRHHLTAIHPVGGGQLTFSPLYCSIIADAWNWFY